MASTELKKNYPTKVIVASIMGRNEEEWGVSCPQGNGSRRGRDRMQFLLPEYGRARTGSDVGQDPETVRR